MINLSGIRHGILNIDSLSLPAGHTCIIGENGSGKSTLLRLLSGIELPKKGKILSDYNEIRNINVGYVPEFPERNIIFEDVFDEIASPLRFSWTKPEITTEKTTQTLKMLGISNLLNRKSKNLSGGEKALVSLAVALITDPEILILDEPDSHMDSETSNQFQTYLKKSKISHIVHCTQDMNIADKSDFLVFMEKGETKYAGTPDFVFENLEKTPFLPLSRRILGLV